MTASPIERLALLRRSLALFSGCALAALATAAMADHVSTEQDIVNLRLGQRIQVDDGTCPAGQVKEISGSKMSSTGVVRAQKCIPRLGPKYNPVR